MLSRSVLYSSSQRAMLGLFIDRTQRDLFIPLDWEFFLKKGKKGEYFGLGMGPNIGPW